MIKRMSVPGRVQAARVALVADGVLIELALALGSTPPPGGQQPPFLAFYGLPPVIWALWTAISLGKLSTAARLSAGVFGWVGLVWGLLGFFFLSSWKNSGAEMLALLFTIALLAVNVVILSGVLSETAREAFRIANSSRQAHVAEPAAGEQPETGQADEPVSGQ